MKKTFIILCFLAAIPVYQLFSQFDQSGSFLRDNEVVAARRSFNKLSYDRIAGSPYYSKDFVNSIVFLPKGDSGLVSLRYDQFQDEMEFKRDDKILWLNKKEIKVILYGKAKEKIVVSTLPDDTSKLAFYFLQASGKYSLLSKKVVEYHPYVPPKPYGEPIPERFDYAGEDYYLKTEGMPPRIFRTKKALSALLSDNKAALDFIKNEKTKVDDPKDLQKLIDFMNNQ